MNYEMVCIGLGFSKEFHLAAFKAGVLDGYEQGSELSMGWTFNDIGKQDAYDVGTHLGAIFKNAGWPLGEN